MIFCLTDRVDVGYVIDEIPLSKVHRNFTILTGFLKNTSRLSLADAVHCVHGEIFQTRV